MEQAVWLLVVVIIVAAMVRRTRELRDHYVVIREFRIVQPNEFGKGKSIESSFVHYFDDYSAARAFFDLHNTYAAHPHYEDQQNINYLYAVPALTAKKAGAMMTKKVHYEAKLLVETPYSIIQNLKKHWDEERRARLELEKAIKEEG